MDHRTHRNYSRPTIHYSVSSPNTTDTTFPFSDTNGGHPRPLHHPFPLHPIHVRTLLLVLLILLISHPPTQPTQPSKRSKSVPRARAQQQQQQHQQQQQQQQQHQHQHQQYQHQQQQQQQQPEQLEQLEQLEQQEPQPDQRPPSSASSSTHIQRPARDSFLSQHSTATSAYPPSTITSAFSGPDTPPSPLSPSSQVPAVAEHALYTPSIRPDDISSRLRLLAVNSYFLPPAHAKPTPQELAPPSVPSATTTPSKSPVFRDLFKLKSPASTSPAVFASDRQQIHIPPPLPPLINPPVTRGPRLMVLREQLDDLDALATAAAAQTSLIEPSTSVIGLDIDPTTAVDVEYPEQRPNVHLQSPAETEQDAWKKELLQQAVGLSFASPRPSVSKPTSPQPHLPRKLAVSPPPVRAPLPATKLTIAQQIVPLSLASPSVRSPNSFMGDPYRGTQGSQMNPNSTSQALPPPPRPSREPTISKNPPSRTALTERSSAPPGPEPLPIWPVAVAQRIPALNVETASYASSLPRPSHGEQSRFSLDTVLQVDARMSDESSSKSGMRGGPGRKVSWEGGVHGALSPPPRLSVATERGRWTPSRSVDHDDERLSTAGSATARPSMTESLPSLPRQSMSSQASQASFHSTTFGPRSTSRSKAGLFARARSTSPSRSSVSSKQSRSRSRTGRGRTEDRLPMRSSVDGGGHYSETDANSMIVYVQPHTRAISSTAVSGSTPTTLFVADDSTPVPPLSAALDRKRGITNAPMFDTAHPGGSGIFGGFKRDRSPAHSMRSAILPSNTGTKPWDSLGSIAVRPVQSDHGHGSMAVQPQARTLEQWRETQIVQEEARRFEGMLVQHIEDEKDRIRKIAFGAHSRRGSMASTTSSPA